MIWIVLLVLIVALDRITKIMILENVGYNRSIPIIDGFFSIVHSENSGAALGILQNGRVFLIPVTLITALIIGYIMYKTDNRLLKSSLSLILGGALGNLIDRVSRGSVVDFLDFQFGSWHFWTFNIADIFIVAGSLLLAYYMLFIYQEPETEKNKNINTEKNEE